MSKVGIAVLLIGLALAGCQSAAPPISSVTPTETVVPNTPPPVSTPPPSPVHPIGVSINNQAPDFQMVTLTGENISLSGLRGRPVILNFWATWCGPCRAEMPLLQQIHDEWAPKGLVLLEINWRDKPETIQKFMTEFNLSMNVPMDSDGQVSKTYLIGSIPATFFIDKDGIIRNKVIGAFPNKAAIESSLNLIMP